MAGFVGTPDVRDARSECLQRAQSGPAGNAGTEPFPLKIYPDAQPDDPRIIVAKAGIVDVL